MSDRVPTSDAFWRSSAYLSLNYLLKGIVSCSQCYFVQIHPISKKFNLFVTGQPMDRRTDRRTDGQECIKINERMSDEQVASDEIHDTCYIILDFFA